VTFLASPLAKLAIVAGLVLGAYAYGRMDGNRLCEGRYAEAAVEAQRTLHRTAERLSEANRERQGAEAALRRERLSAARSAAPSCEVGEDARETARGLMGK
jgi:hypothetical protein